VTAGPKAGRGEPGPVALTRRDGDGRRPLRPLAMQTGFIGENASAERVARKAMPEESRKGNARLACTAPAAELPSINGGMEVSGFAVPESFPPRVDLIRRWKAFQTLVGARDAGTEVVESRAEVARRFDVTEAQVRPVQAEGSEREWPPLQPEGDP
jgi:hypothetical protein